MKKRGILACLIAGALGVGLHFLYPALPNRLTALIAPVNESVWEHLKLLFWPSLAVMAVLSRSAQDKRAFWSAALSGVLGMPPLLLGIYYTALGAFGIESVVFDITLYFVALFAGFALFIRLWETGRASRYTGTLAMVAGIYAMMLILFTFAAPNLPIFISKV